MGNDISKALFDKRQELELKYEARTREHELEVKKAEMNHQHKIIELMALMKQTKFQGGKELLLSYMETLNIIIRQNSTVFEKAASLLDQLGNDNLPESLKKSIEKAVQKDLEVLNHDTLFIMRIYFCFFII